MGEMLLDMRGMRCPWPALRVARAIRETDAGGGDGVVIVAVADDPAAPREIAALASERGWRISPQVTEIGPGLRLIAEGS